MTAKECVDRLHAMQSKAKEKDREALKIAAFVLEHSVLVPEAGAWALKERSEDNVGMSTTAPQKAAGSCGKQWNS